MKLPFIDTEAAGLYLESTEVIWVGLQARWGHFHRVRFASEPIGNPPGESNGNPIGNRIENPIGNPIENPAREGGVRAALARLTERVAPVHPFVAAHLDPEHVRLFVLDGPGFDDEEAFQAWVHDQAARRLPPGGRLETFVLRYRLVERTDERTRCLLALAPKEAVEERVQLLAEAGLRPLLLSALEADLSFALAYQPGFVEGRSAALLVRRTGALLVTFRDGAYQSSVPLGAGSADPDALAALAAAALVRTADSNARPARLFVAGAAADVVAARLQEAPPEGCTVMGGHLPLPAGRRTVPLPAAQVPAAALALHHLYPALEAIDFLDASDATAALQEQEKREAVQVLLYSGGGVLALLLAALLVTAVLGAGQARTGAELVRLADQVAEVEAARGALERLEREVVQAERLVTERTHAAVVLEQVGRAVPERLWLDALRLEAAPEGRLQLALEGAALGEGSLSSFLDRLERAPAMQSVRLTLSETVPARLVYRDAAVQDQSLVRFEINLAWAPGAPADSLQP